MQPEDVIRRGRLRPLPVLLMGVALALVGAGVLVFFALPMRAAALASLEWPTVEGTVTRSDVAYVSDNDGQPTYGISLAYEFVVDGRPYTGREVWIGSEGYSNSNEQMAIGVVERYPVGYTATVYYDPADPSRAVLEPGANSKNLMPTYISAAMLAGGVVVMLVGGVLWVKR